jgi:hypothetical protein
VHLAGKLFATVYRRPDSPFWPLRRGRDIGANTQSSGAHKGSACGAEDINACRRVGCHLAGRGCGGYGARVSRGGDWSAGSGQRGGCAQGSMRPARVAQRVSSVRSRTPSSCKMFDL